MEELKYQKREEVEPKGLFERAICFKPRLAPIVCLIVGLLLLIVNNIGIRILGGFFVLMAVLVFVLIKDYKVLDIFSEGVMVYNDEAGKYCCFIEYKDVKTWDVKHEKGQDKIIFVMNDNSVVERTSFQIDRSRKILMKYMKEKEVRYIKAKRSNEKPFSIPETFRVIRDKFLNRK